jgi:hypothetical protein
MPAISVLAPDSAKVRERYRATGFFTPERLLVLLRDEIIAAMETRLALDTTRVTLTFPSTAEHARDRASGQ